MKKICLRLFTVIIAGCVVHGCTDLKTGDIYSHQLPAKSGLLSNQNQFFVSSDEHSLQENVVSGKLQKAPENWNELVKDSVNIVISDSLVASLLVNVTHIDFLSTGKIVLPDGYGKVVYIIDQSGNIEQKIDKTGRGPGEFNYLSKISVDRGDNIYVYDPSQKKIIQYIAPEYKRFEEYYTKFSISVMEAWFGPVNFFTYSPYSEYLFNKLDLTSKETMASAVLPDDKNFKRWLARIQTGGIVKGENKTLYGLYPENLTIYKFDLSLNTIEKIEPESDKEFYQPFPGNLNPYGHDERHENWWQTFNHIARIKYLQPGQIIVTYYGAGKTYNEVSTVFLNIYDIDSGNALAEDIRLPKYADIAGVDGEEIYVIFRAHLDDEGNEIPFKLVKYRFKIF